MAAGAAPDEVVEAVADELRSLLGLRECWFDTSRSGTTGSDHRPQRQRELGADLVGG